MSRFRQALAVALAAAGILAATAEAREPVISVEPQRGIPGLRVLVTGRGFCGSSGCGHVRIQLYGAVVATDVSVSSSGTFARRIRIPGGAPTGEVGLTATQTLEDGSEHQAFADFEMAVQLRAQPAAKPKARAGAVAVPDRGVGSETVPTTSRGDPAAESAASSSAPSVRQEATSAPHEPVDASGTAGVIAVGAALVLLLGAAAALAVVVAGRTWRSRD